MKRMIGSFAVCLVLFLAVLPVQAISTREPVTACFTKTPVVLLTFDDGPHRWHTPLLLEILEKYKVPATFFVVGLRCVENPELLRRIHEKGHTIANHSWSHPRLQNLDEKTVEEQVRFCNQAVEAITGVRPRFFRPPGGHWNQTVLRITDEKGMYLVLWTLNGCDVSADTPDKIARSVLANTTPGTIILLHDGFDRTLEALPAIIEGLRARGFFFANFDQAFPVRTEPVPLTASNPQ